MRNPFRSEADAYRFLLLTVAYFALIVAAAAIETWLGLVVFVALTALVVWRVLRLRQDEAPLPTAAAATSEDVRRILVVANETVGGDELFAAIAARSEGVDEEVLVVCPALNSPLRTWVSDEDGAREAAQRRLDATLARLAAAGVEARGEVGDGDPVQAIDDALRTFGARRDRDLDASRGSLELARAWRRVDARERFDVPITHVVVDLAADGA